MNYATSIVAMGLPFMAALTGKKVSMWKALDYCQITSLYLYTYIIFPININSVLKIYRYSTITPILNRFYVPFKKNYTID